MPKEERDGESPASAQQAREAASEPRRPILELVDRIHKEKNDGPHATYQNLYLELYTRYGKAGVLQQIDQYTARYHRKGNRQDLVKIIHWTILLDECEGQPRKESQ